MAHTTVHHSYKKRSQYQLDSVAKPDLEKGALVNCIRKTISSAVSKKLTHAAVQRVCSRWSVLKLIVEISEMKVGFCV